MKYSVWIVALYVLVILSSTAEARSPNGSLGLRYYRTKTAERPLDFGKTETYAWLEYQELDDLKLSYTIELGDMGVVPIKLLELTDKGPFRSVVARMVDIRERLEYALNNLLCEPHSNFNFRLVPEDNRAVGIYIDRTMPIRDDYYPIRIMTVYPGDASSFAVLDDKVLPLSTIYLATYFAAQIEAHFMLFIKKEREYSAYEKLALNRTQEGTIYREIYKQANEYSSRLERPLCPEAIAYTLRCISPQQRWTLQSLSYLLPRHWSEDYSGLLIEP